MGKHDKHTKTKRKSRSSSLGTIHDSFMKNMEGLDVFVAKLAPVAIEHDKAEIEELRATAKRIATEIMEDEEDEGIGAKGKGKGRTATKLSPAHERELADLADIILESMKPRLTPPQIQLLYKSSFVMLICYFDFLVSDLVRHFYKAHPEGLPEKESSIKLSELQHCGDISEAMDYIMDREIDKVLYQSLDNQIKYFENTLRVDARNKTIDWRIVNEAVERRNIIVHNSSKFNKRYLQSVDLSIVPEKPKDLKEDQEITLNESYFKAVFDEVLIAGVVLTQCCWRKWAKDDIQLADEALNAAIYDALEKEQWQLAERLGLFSKEVKHCNEQARLFMHINYCQSLKWQGKEDFLQKELDGLDVSTLSPVYQLAVCALKSDKKGFYRTVEKAINVDDLTEEDFKDWPIFRERRKDRDFEKRIKAAFESASLKGKSNADSSN